MTSNLEPIKTQEGDKKDTESGRDQPAVNINNIQTQIQLPKGLNTEQENQSQIRKGNLLDQDGLQDLILGQSYDIHTLNQLLLIKMKNKEIQGQELLSKLIQATNNVNNSAEIFAQSQEKAQVRPCENKNQAFAAEGGAISISGFPSQKPIDLNNSRQDSDLNLSINAQNLGQSNIQRLIEQIGTSSFNRTAAVNNYNISEALSSLANMTNRAVQNDAQSVVTKDVQLDGVAENTQHKMTDSNENEIMGKQVIAKNGLLPDNESLNQDKDIQMNGKPTTCTNLVNNETNNLAQQLNGLERPQVVVNPQTEDRATAFQNARTAQAIPDGCSIQTNAAIRSWNQNLTYNQQDGLSNLRDGIKQDIQNLTSSGDESRFQLSSNSTLKTSIIDNIYHSNIQNQNSNSQAQRTTLKSQTRTNMQPQEKLNTIQNAQSQIGKSLVHNMKSQQDAQMKLSEMPVSASANEAHLQQIQNSMAQTTSSNVNAYQIQNNLSGPSLINQLMTLLNNRQQNPNTSQQLSAGSPELPPSKNYDGLSPQRLQDQQLKQLKMKLCQIQGSNQTKNLSQVILNAHAKSDQKNIGILEEKAQPGEDDMEREKAQEVEMQKQTDGIEAVETPKQTNQIPNSSIRSISHLNNMVQNFQQDNIQNKGFKTLPNTFSDDDLKSHLVNNSSVSACNGSVPASSSIVKSSSSPKAENGLSGSGINSDESVAAHASAIQSHGQQDKLISQSQLNTFKQQLQTQINNNKEETSMLQQNQQATQSKSINLQMQQNAFIQQKIQMYKEQLQNGNGHTVQSIQSLTSKLQPQSNQITKQSFDPSSLNKINFQPRIVKQQESNMSTIGGLNTASESNLTTIMSSNKHQQQVNQFPAPSQLSKINFSPQRKQAVASNPNQLESLQTQIKQLIHLLGVVNNNSSQQVQQNQQMLAPGQGSYNEQNINSIESALKNSLSPVQMEAILQIPGLNNLLSFQRSQTQGSVGTQFQQNQSQNNNMTQIMNQENNKPQQSPQVSQVQNLGSGQQSNSHAALLQQLQNQILQNQKSSAQVGISNQGTQNGNAESITADLGLIQNLANQRQQQQPGHISQLSQQLKQISQLQNNLGSAAPQISNQALVQAIQTIQSMQNNTRTSHLQSTDQMNLIAQLGSLASGAGGQTSNQQNLTQQINQISRISQMIGTGNGAVTQESLSKLSGVLQAQNRNAPSPVLNMTEITGKQPSNLGVDAIISSDINALKDMIWDDDEDQMNRPSQSFHDKNGFKTTQYTSQMLNPRSKGIKKSIDHITLSQLHSNAMNSDGYGSSQAILRGNEKIQDKGDYFLIHRLNNQTKRMNQILQCKKCPLKFPKLCNLRDHLRIHNDDMPFKCNLCQKPFTQAGNRDRHEKKKVCKKRLSIQMDPNGNEIYITSEQSIQESKNKLSRKQSSDQLINEAQLQQNNDMNANITHFQNLEKQDAKMTIETIGETGVRSSSATKTIKERRDDEKALSQAQLKEPGLNDL